MNFYENKDFEFVRHFEDNWEKIRDEYFRVEHKMLAWPETSLYKDGWDAFGIFDFPYGRETPFASFCPITRDLVKEVVPDHGSVSFSRLSAGTEIKPHTGYQGDFLRLHLGLIIPEGDLGLRCGNEVRSWEEGKVFIFDDRLEHEAWNRGKQDRIVLLLDFVPEEEF